MSGKRLNLLLFLLALMLLTLVFAHAAPAAPDQVVVYDDALATGWEDWSWGGVTRDLANPSPVYDGSASIAVTFTGGWSGLQFGRGEPLDVSGYDHLRFWVHGGTAGGQQVQVNVSSGCGSASRDIILTTDWTLVQVPLSDLGSPAEVTGLSWFNPTAGSQPTFFLDGIAFVASGGPTPTPVPPVAGPALSVDAGVGRHVISPYIYGMNFADEALAAELNLPVRRWGGNATTRYNWQIDVSNRAMDWYYENIPNPDPGTLPDGSEADLFVEQNMRTGTETLLTVPLIGWTPKSREVTCGFSIAKYGPQTDADYQWRPDCGNGVHLDGTNVTGNDPLDTSLPITPTFVQQWIAHLVSRYGTAENGGVQFYNLDNEPMLWNDTHRDIHPEPTSYDEVRDRTYAYAAAIKEADSTAKTVGPAVWGWTAYFWSALDWSAGGQWWLDPQDRLAHGDTPFLEWYLEQMHDYELQHGVRILDYLDVHFYPQGSGIFSDNPGDAATQALRLRSTRALWDTTYVDESWIDEPVYLIPRMRQWVTDNYPGTGTAIGEYNWGAHCHINGALAQAEVLGIFGRERLDLATLWDPPQADQPAAYAFRMYLNYDGNGSAFGDVGVSATSADTNTLSIFASQRSADGALTLMILNKTDQPLTSTVSLAGFTPTLSAAVYRYSGQRLDTIVREADQPLGVDGFTAVWPANSMTLVVIPQAGEMVERVYLPLVEK